MSRKYRHRGYQDSSDGRDRPQPNRSRSRSFSDRPRAPRMTKFQEVFRCALCGANLPATFDDISVGSRCPRCRSALHTCKNCAFFDPSSRFECTQPVTKRVSAKDQGNQCRFFEARTTVEKEVSSSKSLNADDARSAFERLFKK